MLKLWCPYCDMPQYHEIRQWQTEAGVYGAISVLCKGCGEVTILNLKEGKQLIINWNDDEDNYA